ncbi:MAG: hypothetical protein ACK56F_05120, partial [bacterium]
FLTLDPLAGMEKLAPLFQDKQPEPQYCFYAWTHNSEKTSFLKNSKTSKQQDREFTAYDTNVICYRTLKHTVGGYWYFTIRLKKVHLKY